MDTRDLYDNGLFRLLLEGRRDTKTFNYEYNNVGDKIISKYLL